MDKQFYVINSRKEDPSNPGNTQLKVKLDIDWSHEYDSMYVCSLSIPKSFYTLPTTSYISVSEDGGAYVAIEVKAGNYNIESLANELKASLNDSKSLTYTYDITYADAFLARDPVKYTINITGNAGQIAFSVTEPFLAQLLGIRANTVYNTADDTFESPYVLNFQPYDELLITSDIVTNRSQLVQEVYTAGNAFNDSIIWHCPDASVYGKTIHKTDGNLYSFNIMTVDGRYVDLQGSSWSMVICIYRKDFTNGMIRDYIRVKALE